MLQQTGRAKTHEYGVSDTIGAVMLIALVAGAIAIISVSILSQPPPEKIPALEAVISNTGNTVQILHNGGDSLQYGDFKVLIDNNPVDVTPSGTTWSQGETLTFPNHPGVKSVQILYTKGGNTATAVMSSANFGGIANTTMSLTIMAGAGAGGSISPSGAVVVPYGGSQIFDTRPSDHSYRITDVKVDGISVPGAVFTPWESYTYTFSGVTTSHAIYAVFAKNPVITATAGDHGALSPSGAVIVNYTGSQRFDILPDPGYRIQDVQIDGVSNGTIMNCTFSNVLIDHTLSAAFALNPVISSTAGANGTISPLGDVSVDYGGSQAYTITPNTGHHVVDVQIDGVSNGTIPSYTFINVVANHTIAATFAINQSTITPSVSGGNGTVSPATVQTVNWSDTPTYTFTPSTGYHLNTVTVNGTVVTPTGNTYTFPPISATQPNQTIVGTFAIDQYTITPSVSGGNGTVSPATVQTVNWSDTPTYTFTPSTGYHLNTVTVNGTVVTPTGNTYTFPAVDTNKTLVATFAINQYTITPSVTGGNGTVSPSSVQTVNYGETPTFTFTPSTGYHLNTVTVNGTVVTPTGNTYMFPAVDTNKTLVATFAINQYTITPSVTGGNGTVSPSSVQTVNYGETPTFTFTPSTGYHLNTVTVNGTVVTPTGNTYTFPAVTTNQTIVGTFSINQYTITPSVSGGNGTVSPATVQTVNYGDTPTFTFTPSMGYHLNAVTVNGTVVTPTGNTYTFPAVDTNKTLVATFAINQYTINATAGSNGAVSPGNVTVNYGGSQAYTIIPTTGYHVASVLVDGVSNGTITSYTFTNVQANHTLAATFAINTYNVNATTDANGSVSPGNVTVNYNGNVTETLTPTTGYHVASVLVDGISNGTITSYNFTNVQVNHTLAATFAINQYNINATAGSNGAVSPGNVTVNYGGSQLYNITPTAGYHVASVLVDGVSNGTITSYNFTNVQANHTLAATFAINTYTVNATTDSNGSVSPGNVTVSYNGYVTETLTPTTGYHVASVLVDGVSNGTITSYNFTNVVANHTLSATFAINRYTINATSGGNGTVLPGNVTVDYGGNQLYNITPNTGFHISNVLVDGVSNGTITNYNFTNVVANHTIAATFVMIPPVANFTATPLTGGLPLTVTFNDTSTNNPTSWIWNFGAVGGNSTQQNPTYTYTQPGNYSVELWATNDGGTGYFNRSGYIFTYYAAKANFTVDTTLGAKPLTVQFTDLSEGSPSYYNWSFGTIAHDLDSVNFSESQNPEYTYHYAGLYSVNLTVANTFSSDHLLRVNYINVTPPPPVSDFQTYDNNVDMNLLDHGGAPLSVFFYDLSSNDPTSWTWNFGDGNITSITKDGSHEYADIYHTFTNPGSYNVSLTANNAWGSSTAYHSVTVFAAPTFTSLSPTAGPVAGGQTVTITGTNLVGAKSVMFGGTANATGALTVNSATSITVTTPAHTAGTVDVIVSTTNGSVTGSSAYRYAGIPTIGTLSLNTGTSGGGNSTIITGTNLTGANYVTFGGTANATGSLTVTSDTSITVTTPAHTAGTVNVVVTTPGGSATLSNGFDYYTLVTYTSSGTLTLPASGNITKIDYLIIGGGGGGGYYGGGGGAGGYLSNTWTNMSSFAGMSYKVYVGGGGAGGTLTNGYRGLNGGNSSFANTTPTNGFNAKGGGGGGSSQGTTYAAGLAGGSGGGGAYNGGAAGQPASGQGYAGGAGYQYTSGRYNGGGGGGATAVGTASTSQTSGGIGGAGITSSISGASVTYACGGGGGGRGAAGTAGCSIAGAGRTTAAGYSATASYGGGGGGGGTTYSGGAGGSGIVILKYY